MFPKGPCIRTSVLKLSVELQRKTKYLCFFSRANLTTKRRSKAPRPVNIRRRNARVKPDNLQSKTKLQNAVQGEVIGPFGLRRIDYSVPPPAWPLPPHPPPRSNPARRYFPHTMAGLAAAFGVWIYFNQDTQVYDYWRQVEQGNVPVMYDDDDDEEGDDEDEEDEWEDNKDSKKA